MTAMDTHPLPRVAQVEQVGPFTLRVTFDDASEQTIDFLPVLRGELFGPLRDAALFAQVRIDQEAHTLVWPNGADFDPATLHDWPALSAELIERSECWAATIA